jgi:Cu/Ag efflux pump CusA
MERLMRDHTRQVVGGVLVVVAAVVLLVGYANIRDETAVAIQMPYVLTGGIGALILTGLGMVVLRSQDDKAVLERLSQVEAVNEELRERVDYLTQLLEAALLPDEAEPKVTTRRQAAATSAPAPS